MSNNRYNTQNFDLKNYHVSVVKQDYFKYSYVNKVVLLWNKLPKDYKCVMNLIKFEKKLLDFYMKKLETDYDLPGSI